jgi:hypothetical protein
MNAYALLDGNNVVSKIIVLPEEQLSRAEQFIANDLGLPGTWLACDTNSYRGKRRDGTPGTAFRKNYPFIGSYYDSATDSFWEPKPSEYPSWILDSDGGFWKPPVPPPGVRPAAGNVYKWDEATVSWIQVPR